MSDRQRPEQARSRPASPGASARTRLPSGSAAIPSRRPEPFRYTMQDLVDQTGFSARTVRYYITEGLIPPAHGRGPNAVYDAGHLLRLQAIKRLKDEHLPLEEIRQKLGALDDRDLSTLLQVESAPPADLWRRVILHPDLELMMREQPSSASLADLLDLLESIRFLVRERLEFQEGAPNR